MPSDILQTLAIIFFAGVAVSIIGGTIMPFLITAAVVWVGWHVARGLYG